MNRPYNLETLREGNYTTLFTPSDKWYKPLAEKATKLLAKPGITVTAIRGAEIGSAVENKPESIGITGTETLIEYFLRNEIKERKYVGGLPELSGCYRGMDWLLDEKEVKPLGRVEYPKFVGDRRLRNFNGIFQFRPWYDNPKKRPRPNGPRIIAVNQKFINTALWYLAEIGLAGNGGPAIFYKREYGEKMPEGIKNGEIADIIIDGVLEPYEGLPGTIMYEVIANTNLAVIGRAEVVKNLEGKLT